MLFAKALKGADVGALLSNIGSAAGPAAAGPAAAAEVAEVKEEKKEEAEAVDMGGLFGDDDDYWTTPAPFVDASTCDSIDRFRVS